MKKTIAAILALVMILALTACGKSEAAKAADAKIDAIGEVTLDSGTAIANAENAVKALSEEDLNALSGRSKLEKARDTYDALVLVDMIDHLSEETDYTEADVKHIRDKYNSISKNAQQAVTNYNTFKDIEASLAEDTAPDDKEGTEEAKAATPSTPFTNEYGTPTTKCAHSGCNNYIASSGDTNCCTTHSNKCLSCGKYIDEDAMYCIRCLTSAANKNTTSSSSGEKCHFKQGGQEVCNNPCVSGENYCSYHLQYLTDAFNSLFGG